MNHTPGPWKTFDAFINNEENHYVIVQDKWHDRFIADCGPSARGNWENEANARLVAAAPELLEACKSALALIDILTDFKGMSTSKELSAAIAKAEGRE